MASGVRSGSCRCLIQECPTDFFLSVYSNKVVIFVSQTGTVGTVLHAKNDFTMSAEPIFNSRVLVGRRDDDATYICARRISEAVNNTGLQMPMIICLAFKCLSLPSIKSVVDAISNILQHEIK